MREIKRILSTESQKVGEHQMYQSLPNHEFKSIDPFLLLHHHGPHTFGPYNQGLPFGPHPHRGFETLTFIYKGSVEHADSQGFKSVIEPGGVQWMTAGRGIVHSENIPAEMRENGGELEIIQLWMNLPAKLKMTPPDYQGIQKETIPVTLSKDGKVSTQVISGELNSTIGPAKSITDLTVLNISAVAGGEEIFIIPKDNNVLFYVLYGEVVVNGKLAIDHQLIEFNNQGDEISIKAQSDVRFILSYGKPLNEPLVSQGPFVMNTTTEIMQALRDYQMGKMGVM
jgi:redox-sensitive bicupin YhaK (pirin superfamily)